MAKKFNKKDKFLYIGIGLFFAALVLLGVIIALLVGGDDGGESSVPSAPIQSITESSEASVQEEGSQANSESSVQDETSEPVSQEESSAEPIKTGWVEENGKKYYYDNNGNATIGKSEIDGKVYIFDSDGGMIVSEGWVDYAGDRYYLNKDGSAYIGWLDDTDDGHKYYLQKDGSAAQGEVVIEGKTYFFTESGKNFIMVNPWHPVPEDYNPELVRVSSSYAGNEKSEINANTALDKMMTDGRNAGYNIYVADAYRTNDDQAWLFNRRVNSYINQGYSQEEAYNLAKEWSAIPGTSEHELGMAFDIIDTWIWDLVEEQETLAGQQWLMENCWKYGFILRYPKDKKDETGINYEPWHYRYFGLEIAKEIHDSGLTVEGYIKSLTKAPVLEENQESSEVSE